MSLKKVLDNPLYAHVVPFVVFMLFTSLPDLFRIDNEQLPWYRHSPEQWVYPLQTTVVGALLFAFRKHYTLAPWKHLGLATLLGLMGIGIWILPAWGYSQLEARGVSVPEWAEWLGFAPRLDGFDPSFFQDQTGWYFAAVFMRFVRMVVIVALIEEIFWRGFLMKFLVRDDLERFHKAPFGVFSWKNYAIVTGLFMLVHHHTDWLGAFVFGSMMYYLAVKSKSLGACVVMHGVANLALGIYVMYTKQWGYW